MPGGDAPPLAEREGEGEVEVAVVVVYDGEKGAEAMAARNSGRRCSGEAYTSIHLPSARTSSQPSFVSPAPVTAGVPAGVIVAVAIVAVVEEGPERGWQEAEATFHHILS